MSEIEKMYKNAGIKSEYRYDCNLADTIKPVEVFPLRSCSKGEIKDYCTNKQDYRYCKVYKVNKIYPPFTAEKQIELIKWLLYNAKVDCLNMFYKDEENYLEISINCKNGYSYENSFDDNFEIAMASVINTLWQSLTSEEKQQVKGILE